MNTDDAQDACESQRLATDGSGRWMGLLLLLGSATGTAWGMYALAVSVGAILIQ